VCAGVVKNLDIFEVLELWNDGHQPVMIRLKLRLFDDGDIY
jgi:hypothetical protein